MIVCSCPMMPKEYCPTLPLIGCRSAHLIIDQPVPLLGLHPMQTALQAIQLKWLLVTQYSTAAWNLETRVSLTARNSFPFSGCQCRLPQQLIGTLETILLYILPGSNIREVVNCLWHPFRGTCSSYTAHDYQALLQ